MLNKNVADYTNFDGKTNKRIVQAPGGASSFSLAWSNDKTDYGPERNYRKKDNAPIYNEPPRQESRGFQQPGKFNYNEPIKVLDEKPLYEPNTESYEHLKPNIYSSQSQSSQNSRKIGGQYGYGNYSPEDKNQYSAKGKQLDYYQQDSLDLKLKQQTKSKGYGNIPLPPQDKRSSIKIHEQKSNMLLGDNNYNYWKDNGEERKPTNQSNRRSTHNQESPQMQVQNQAHTSVKVHNPPGGKSNFTLG